MSNVIKHTNSPDANARATAWMADRAIGWLVFGIDWDDETVTLTEAGRAALAQALREDAELEAAGVTCECAACGLALIACRCRRDQ